MSESSFIFLKGDIVMTAYGMILLRHGLPNGLVCQDLALQFWDKVY